MDLGQQWKYLENFGIVNLFTSGEGDRYSATLTTAAWMENLQSRFDHESPESALDELIGILNLMKQTKGKI